MIPFSSLLVGFRGGHKVRYFIADPSVGRGEIGLRCELHCIAKAVNCQPKCNGQSQQAVVANCLNVEMAMPADFYGFRFDAKMSRRNTRRQRRRQATNAMPAWLYEEMWSWLVLLFGWRRYRPESLQPKPGTGAMIAKGQEKMPAGRQFFLKGSKE